MTISLESSRVDYTGNATTDTYAYPFKIYDDDELVVIQKNASTFAETVLTKTTDYTVTGVGALSGGTVVLVAGNLASGQLLIIKRVRPLTQDADIRNQGAFYPEVHENEFDKLVMQDQQLDEKIERSLKLPEGIDPDDFDSTLPVDIGSAAGQAIIVNSNGDGFDLGALSGVTDTTKVAKAGDTMTGNLLMNQQKEVRFYDTDSSNYVGLKASGTVASDITFTLPTALPASTRYANSTSAGVMGFSTANEIDATRTMTMSSSTATAGNVAISTSSGAFSSNSTTFVDVTNLSVTLTTVGRPVKLMLVDDGSGTAAGIQCNDNASTNTQAFFQFVRGVTALTNCKLELGVTGGTAVNSFVPPSSLQHVEVPAAGTYTYKLQARMIAGDTNVQVARCKLIAYEL